MSTFRAKETPKSLLFKAKNNAQTTSEQPQTNFQKVQKTGFMTLKIVKMTSQRAKFCLKILILELIYQPFNLKIQLKVGLLGLKIMPTPPLNTSKPNIKKFNKKRIFLPPKWSR